MGKKNTKKVQSEEDPQDSESPSEEDNYDDGEPKKNKKSKKASATKKVAKATPKKSKAAPEKQKQSSNKKTAKNPAAKNVKEDEDEEEDVKGNKKKDFLPGQRFPTPDQDDGARAFYTSLYAQNPNSQIAQKYCLDYGLLDKNDAVKLQKQMKKKK